MRKKIFNIIFYFACFCIVFISVYRLAFFVPPMPGTEAYRKYLYSTIAMGIGIGLMVIVPNLIVEYLSDK